MKLTQVYITLEEYEFEPLVRAKYQFLGNYLTLFISDWLKKLFLDLGLFNRIVFQEGNDRDMSIVGDKAFRVCIEAEFISLDNLNTNEKVHNYFVNKYIEGFSRFDNKFGLNLTSELRLLLEQEFNKHFVYDKKIKSKKIGESTILVFHRYKYDVYELIIRILNKNKETIKEEIIYTCDPDPFIVHFDINKVEINNNEILVINQVREKTLIFKI